MSKFQHLDALSTVARATIAGEKATDATLRGLADLVSTTTAQAEAINLPPSATQPALDHLQTAITAAFDSRRAVVLAHHEFGVLARKLGASPEAFGDLWPCPQFPKSGDEAVPVILRRAA
jgi:hypothetical protein